MGRDKVGMDRESHPPLPWQGQRQMKRETGNPTVPEKSGIAFLNFTIGFADV